MLLDDLVNDSFIIAHPTRRMVPYRTSLYVFFALAMFNRTYQRFCLFLQCLLDRSLGHLLIDFSCSLKLLPTRLLRLVLRLFLFECCELCQLFIVFVTFIVFFKLLKFLFRQFDLHVLLISLSPCFFGLLLTLLLRNASDLRVDGHKRVILCD